MSKAKLSAVVVAILAVIASIPSEKWGNMLWVRDAAQAVVKENTGSSSSSSSTKKASSQTTAIASGRYQAKVDSVSDGDTMRVTDQDGLQHKIRMAYIDAPETKQAHGIASRDALREWVAGQIVEVEVCEKDRYGREVAKIYLDGEDVNFKLVAGGYAWHYTAYAQKKGSDEFEQYQAAQEAAKKARKGLWKDRSPQAPWDYRKEQRAQ